MVETKPGKEAEVLPFLKSVWPFAEAKSETVRWYALQPGPFTFGIFNTFETGEGREAHLAGRIAEAVVANASELLSTASIIKKVAPVAIK